MQFILTMSVNDIISWGILGLLLIVIVIIYGAEMIKSWWNNLRGGKK